MRSNDFNVVHVSPRVQAHGGIEALHAVHRTLPLKQAFVALFDRGPEPRPGYVNLNFNWRTTLGQMRREFARTMEAHAGAVVIYHNVWGLPLLCGGDGAARRIAFFHSMPAYHAKEIPRVVSLVDGMLAVTPAFPPVWQAMAPALEPERTRVLPSPANPPPGLSRRPNSGGEIVLGYSGRVERLHKRLDRLPALLRALDAAGLRYRFEVLGTGSLSKSLERQLRGRVRFHGWQEGAAYWRILAGWDGLIFFSDVEGAPIALYEAMSLGIVPFFPRIGESIGDVYVPQVDQRCYYARGDMPALAENLRSVFTGAPPDVAALRDRAQALVSTHTVAKYGGALAEFMERIAELPRRSSPGDIRGRWSDGLPLGLVARAMPGLLWPR